MRTDETLHQRLFAATHMAEPDPNGIDREYWEGLKVDELRLQYCDSCQKWIWGPRWMCGSCHSFDLTWKPVSANGRVYSWARTWHAFIPELAEEIPYITVLVELPEAGGRRVLGLLAEGPDTTVAIGDEVTGVVQHPGDSAWPVLRWQLATGPGTTSRSI